MSLLRRVQALLIGLVSGSVIGYLQGSALIDIFRILQKSPVGGFAADFYSLLQAAMVSYGIWAYIGASFLKGLLLLFVIPAESVTPLYVLHAADSGWEVAYIAAVGAAAITLANFVIYLLSRAAGERFISERGSRKWRFVEWVILENGKFSMFSLRLVPWIGGWAAIPAGVVRLNVRTFLVYSFLGFLTYEGVLGFAAYYGLKVGTEVPLFGILPGLF
ncbi:MAG: VTT domain-containing protein [Candidatus Nanohaloarchaea archaeon]|nr:VTT domain-containing protein [Candidatus Nanohaloarchaea archaeon]